MLTPTATPNQAAQKIRPVNRVPFEDFLIQSIKMKQNKHPSPKSVNFLRKQLKRSRSMCEDLEEATYVDDENRILFQDLMDKHEDVKKCILPQLIEDYKLDENKELDISETPHTNKILVILLKKELEKFRQEKVAFETKTSIFRDNIFKLEQEIEELKANAKKQVHELTAKISALAKDYAGTGQTIQKLKADNERLNNLALDLSRKLETEKQKVETTGQKYAAIFQDKQKSSRDRANKIINDSYFELIREINSVLRPFETHQRPGEQHTQDCFCEAVGNLRVKINPYIDDVRLAVNTNMC